MGFETYSSGDDEEPEDNDPSGTHVYFYQEGHDRLPDDEDVAETLASAYDLARTQPNDGPVRSLANRGWDGGLVHMLAEFVEATGNFLEDEDPSILVEHSISDFDSETQAEAIMAYLHSNPEVGAEVESKINGEEEPAAAEADD